MKVVIVKLGTPTSNPMACVPVHDQVLAYPCNKAASGLTAGPCLLLLLFILISFIDTGVSQRASAEETVATAHWQALPSRDDAPSIRTAPGFSVEKVYAVPSDQGSWVSLAIETKGRMVASDQYGRLYRITPGGGDSETKVEPIDVKVGRAQGLLYAFDSLYVMAHEGDGQPPGMYRLIDTNGDDQYDDIKLIMPLKGGGEHGPHAIVLSPDGQSLYICAGNHTAPPAFQTTALPATWDEDQVLPRQWDAGGHAVGIKAPGGWIAKMNPDGTNIHLVAAGFRNQYDIAFQADGELFTYDADMEWDVGTPWYRPTRVNHVTSGAEFGWRSGTGKWPAYYPDSLPSVVDIGPGSPTGIAFGTGARFPAKYQRALYISDWSYGIIYAVHLEEDGATYKGQPELFCSAPAMQVADLVVNPNDGMLYYVVGGRRTASALYRVKYNGNESTSEVLDQSSSDLQMARRQLESFHAPVGESAVQAAIPFMGHDDRHLRYAARIAIEHQEPSLWIEQLKATEDPQALLEWSLAAIRCRLEDQKDLVLQRLSSLEWERLSPTQQLHLLRNYGLASARLESFASEDWRLVTSHVAPHFPSGSATLDMELARLLTAAQLASATPKILELLTQAATQEEQIHYAYCLAYQEKGWSDGLRETYLNWFLESSAYRGGNSFGGFLANIRKAAVERLPWDSFDENVRVKLEGLANATPESKEPQSALAARPIVQAWTMEELADVSTETLVGRDFENGKKMFALTQCYKCHRFDGVGGVVGPDLSAVGRRFSQKDLLESLIAPSRVVSDQYQASIFQLEDGRVVTGRVVNLNGKNYMVQEDMLNPGKLTNVPVDQIEAQKPSEVSMMPSGLLDTLTKDDIRDLLAYLRSGGDPASPELKTVVE